MAPDALADDVPQTWYFTFGVGIDNQHRNGYYVVENATYMQARKRMIDVFGRDWAFQYAEHEWVRDGVSQAEQYNLHEVK
jgi:hypothetical protein